MKCFCCWLAGFFVVFCLFCGCSIEGTKLPDLVPEEETEEITGDSEPGEAEKAIEKEAEEPVPELLIAEFLSGKAVSETEIEFLFSSPVTMMSMSFEPYMEVFAVEEGSALTVFLEEKAAPGITITVELEVEDEWENILSVQVPLVSRNNRMPELRINELRTEYSKPRAEFIELKMLSDGNLGGLRVFAAGNNLGAMIYRFAPLEVTKGEYVVLHLRTLDAASVDEYGERPDESGGTDACPTARDFWIPGNSKLLRKTDAVYILDQDDRVLDAVMISEIRDTSWNKSFLTDAAEFLFSQDAWKSLSGALCLPVDAVDSSDIKTSATKSISRYETAENTRSSADWYITATGGATPGLPNKQ